MAKELFKIDPDSEVKGNARGQIYVTTTPDHPSGAAGKKIKDHKKTYVPLCIVMLENQMGRLIDTEHGEEVHHKDEDQSNNSLSNLKLVDHDEHAKAHAKKKKFWKKSPLNKPKKKHALKVAQNYLSLIE
jgi:HNH endonuclease